MPNMIRTGKRSGSIHLYQLQKKTIQHKIFECLCQTWRVRVTVRNARTQSPEYLDLYPEYPGCRSDVRMVVKYPDIFPEYLGSAVTDCSTTPLELLCL